MRILVTGGRGLVGRHVVARAEQARHSVLAVSRSTVPALDVRDRAAVERLLRQERPDAVVHAAYDARDFLTTATGTGHVARACRVVGARLVALSTDLVLPSSPVPADERVVPAPTTVYAGAKAAAETAALAALEDVVVVRTSVVVGPGSPQHDLVRAAAHGDAVLRDDEIRCPIHVEDLAQALVELAAGGTTGLLHVAGPQAMSRYELGRILAPHEQVPAHALAHAPRGAAPGPACVVLDCRRARQVLRTPPRPVAQALAAPRGDGPGQG